MRLDALAQAFDQGDLDAFGRGLYSAWGKAGHKANAKWAVFQLSVTSSRDTLARLVDDLNRMASGGRHALAGWLLLVCARHRSPDGPAWNHHWANAALTRGTRNKAREARAYAAERRGWTLDQLKATVDTFILDTVADRALLADPNATPAQLEGRFIQQAAMQRPYTVQALRDGFLAHPGLGAAFASVLWRAEDGRLLTCGQDSAALLDGEEVDLKPEDRLCLVHPAELDPESLDQWRARLCPQPLTQLDREVVRADLSGNKSLKLSASPMTGSAMASALHRSGFHSDAPEDAGWVYGASLRFAPVELTGRMDHGGFVVSSPGFGKKPIHVESAYFTPIEGRDLAALDQVPAGVISEFALALRPFGVTVL